MSFIKKKVKKLLCFLLVIVCVWGNSATAFAIEIFSPDIHFSSPVLYEALTATVDITSYFEKDEFINFMVNELKTKDENVFFYDGYSGEIDISRYSIPSTNANIDALNEYIWYDSPELFRIKSLGYDDELNNDGEWVLTKLYFNGYYTKEEYSSMYDQMIAAAENFLIGIKGNPNLSDIEKALLLHDRIALNCEYDYETVSTDVVVQTSYNAYGVFCLNKAVCMGYAFAYDYLLDKVGIKSVYCSSNRLNHIWNIIYINNKPYHVDVTWDDPLFSNYDLPGRVEHVNFLCSTKKFRKTHSAYDYKTLPNDTSFDDAFWQNINSPFAYNSNADEFYYVDNGESKIKYVKNITTASNDGLAFKNLAEYTWKPSEESYLGGNYSVLATNGERIFYSTPKDVYEINPETKDVTLFYSADSENYPYYNIYGMNLLGCELKVYYWQEVNNFDKTNAIIGEKIVHSNTNWVKPKIFDCTKSYLEKCVCKLCNEIIETRIIEAKNHIEITDFAVSPTCTEKGKTEGKHCSVCNTVILPQKDVEPLGHIFTDWVKKVEPTYENSGISERVCTACDLKETKTIEKLRPLNLSVPTVSAKKSNNGIEVTWNAAEGAESYIIYRKDYSQKKVSWKAIKKGYTKTSYTDTTAKLGVTYEYTVRAVNREVMSGYKSAGKVKFDVKPNVKIANASNGIKVSWDLVANATGYTVYRSEYNTKTKKWSSWSNRGTAKAGVSSWTDKKVTSGKTYKYTVRAKNGSFGSSYKSSNVTIFLSQPTVKWANASTGIKVSWSKVSGATGYTVYRSELKDGKWTSWKNMGTAKSNKSSWVDKKVVSGVTYKYTVRAINGSYKSTYQNKYSLMFLSSPKVVVETVSNGIRLDWNLTNGATQYIIYRAEYNVKNKKWSSWSSIYTAKNEKAQAFVDVTAKSNVKYKYTVRAVNSKGVKSAYVASNVITKK